MFVRTAPPPAAGFANDKAGNGERQVEAAEEPVLALHEHNRPEGPGEHFKGRIEGAYNSRIVQGLGLIVRIDNTQEYEADGKDTCRIAIDEEGPFEPAFVVHLRTNNPEHVRNDNHADDEQHEQRNGIFHDNVKLDRGNAEEDEIIRCCAGNTADDAVVNVVVRRCTLQNEEQGDPQEESKEVARQVETCLFIDEVHNEPAGAGARQKQCEVEGQRIQGRRGDSFIPHGLTVVLRNKAGPQIAGNVREIFNVRRVTFAGSNLSIDEAAENTRQEADCGAGHANVLGIFKAHFCQGRADSSCRAVTTGKARSQKEAEGIVNIREELGNDDDRENDGQAELNGLGQRLIAEVRTETGYFLFHVVLADGKALQANGGEDQDDQRTGIAAEALRKGQEIRITDSQCQEAGNHGRRHEEFLNKAHFTAQELSNEDKQRPVLFPSGDR